MPAEFIQCTECSVFFAKDDSGRSLCGKCSDEPYVPSSPKDCLRYLKSFLRDLESAGEMLTVPELSLRTQVSDTVIWEFIRSGQMDVASFNDPEVRDFVVKRNRERLRESQARTPQAVSSEPEKKRTGFHKRPDH
jgi:hypothetical protein